MAGKLVIAAGLALAASIAAAQEQPARAPGTYLVYFDWGKGEIRGDDAAMLDEVATAWRTRPGAGLQLSGHTDRWGWATNRAAGLKLAQAVRTELDRRGVPKGGMWLASFGEERPLVPTEDGVREVQNRPVEINVCGVVECDFCSYWVCPRWSPHARHRTNWVRWAGAR